MHALGEHAAAAGMGDVEILLHHRAGAADLVTDQAACLRQQQVMDRAHQAASDDASARKPQDPSHDHKHYAHPDHLCLPVPSQLGRVLGEAKHLTTRAV